MHGSVPTFFGDGPEASDISFRIRWLSEGWARHRRVGARPPARAGAIAAHAPPVHERCLLSQRLLPALVVRASHRRSSSARRNAPTPTAPPSVSVPVSPELQTGKAAPSHAN